MTWTFHCFVWQINTSLDSKNVLFLRQMKSRRNEKPIYKLSDTVGWSTHLGDRRATFSFPLLSIHGDLNLYLWPPKQWTNPQSPLCLAVLLLFILFYFVWLGKQALKKKLDLGLLLLNWACKMLDLRGFLSFLYFILVFSKEGKIESMVMQTI